MQLGWLEIIALVIGALAGIGLTLLFQHYRKPRSMLELEAEHNKLKEDVMEHFVTTANLVNDMTDSYKAVFDHLNEGAGNLVDRTELRERLPYEDARVVTLSRIGQSEAESGSENTTTPDTVSPAEPGDDTADEDLEPPRF
jgi:uncharacterized membrane-anchored protein YhcB (DUF1043 family)